MTVIYSEAGPKDVTGNGHHMETQAWLDTETGHCKIITHIWTSNWAVGFTGGLAVTFFGENSKPLDAGIIEWPLGVDGRGVLWKRSSRTDVLSSDIDPAIARQVSQILIIQSHQPRPRLEEIKNEITGNRKTIEEFCQDNPGICR